MKLKKTQISLLPHWAGSEPAHSGSARWGNHLAPAATAAAPSQPHLPHTAVGRLYPPFASLLGWPPRAEELTSREDVEGLRGIATADRASVRRWRKKPTAWRRTLCLKNWPALWLRKIWVSLIYTAVISTGGGQCQPPVEMQFYRRVALWTACRRFARREASRNDFQLVFKLFCRIILKASKNSYLIKYWSKYSEKSLLCFY